MNYLKTAAVSAIIAVAGVSANAATMSLDGGTATTLASAPTFGLDLSAWGGPTGGEAITMFTTGNAGDGGLVLDTGSQLKFTYLGSEAGNINTFEVVIGTAVFTNHGTGHSTVGDEAVAYDAGGSVDFSYHDTTDDQYITNGAFGAADPHVGVAFYKVDDQNWIALFGDGLGDTDYDDMAVLISAVPLPAGGLLLLSGLGGLAALRRKKKAA